MRILKIIRDGRIKNFEESGMIFSEEEFSKLCDDIVDGLSDARREGVILTGLGLLTLTGFALVGKSVVGRIKSSEEKGE